MNLTIACATEDIIEIQNILDKKLYKKDDINESLKIIIELCLSDKNNFQKLENIIRLLIKHNPSGSAIDELFVCSVSNGNNPELIYLLQNYCSSQVTALIHRQNQNSINKLYVVGPTEESNLRTFENRKEFKKDKTVLERMKNQRKINDLFIELFLNDNRLTAYRMLNLKREKIPSRYTINYVFSKCLLRKNYGFAEMLCDNSDQTLGVDIDGLNSVFENVVELLDIESVEWFLDQKSIRPIQETIDKTYTNIGIKMYQDEHSIYNSYNFTGRLSYFERKNFFKERKENQQKMKTIFKILSENVTQETIDKLKDHIKKEQSRRYRINNTFNGIHSTEIHGYSRMRVKTDETDEADNVNNVNNGIENTDNIGNTDDIDNIENTQILINPNNIHQRKTINNAVFECIKEKTKKFDPLTEDDIFKKMIRMIKLHLPENKHSASIKKIENLLNSESMSQFGSVIMFLEKYHNDYIETWIKGFIGESIDQHSCDAGVLERIATGLRGIEDNDLNKIFLQAEGPQLLRVFLREGMNIFSNDEISKCNVNRIVKVLKSKGLTVNSKENEVREYLCEYMKESIIAFGLDPDEYFNNAEPIIDIIMDCYDTHLKPFIS